MAEWIKVAELSDLPDEPEEAIRITCRDRPIALFRLEDGVFALDDICSHEYSRLSEGEVWDDEVYCPKHGSRFNIRTGAVRGLPATRPVGSYPVKREGASLYLLWKE